MNYKVKNKVFKDYGAAVNNAARKRCAITDDEGNEIPLLFVLDKVTYNNEQFTVFNLHRDGVTLQDDCKRQRKVVGNELSCITTF